METFNEELAPILDFSEEGFIGEILETDAGPITIIPERYPELETFEKELKKHKALYILTIGLGGPKLSTYLHQFLKTVCMNYKYIRIISVGKAEEAGYGRIRDLLKSIQILSSKESVSGLLFKDYNKCPDTIITFNDFPFYNLPALTGMGGREKRDIAASTSALALQLKDATYKYYDGKEYTYPTSYNPHIDRKELKLKEAIIKSMLSFLNNFEKGDILIDNNALIYGSTYQNLNYEYMPWIPQILSSFNKDDRIFQFKKLDSRDLSRAWMVPFFSPEAVYKMDIYKTYPILDDLGFNYRMRDKLIEYFGKAPEAYYRQVYKCFLEGTLAELPDYTRPPWTCGGAANNGEAAGGAGAAAAGAGAKATGGKRTRRNLHKRRKSRRTR